MTVRRITSSIISNSNFIDQALSKTSLSSSGYSSRKTLPLALN